MENSFLNKNSIENSKVLSPSVLENQNIKEYLVDDYKVSLETRDIIDYNFESDSDDNELRKMIKDMLKVSANSPDLKIFSTDGKQLHIKDFDEAKKKIWSLKDKLYSEGKMDIVDSLNQNTYTRWDNIGGIINMIRDEKELVDEDTITKWKEAFSELEKRKNIEKKTGITDKLTLDLDNLIKEIFNSI